MCAGVLTGGQVASSRAKVWNMVNLMDVSCPTSSWVPSPLSSVCDTKSGFAGNLTHTRHF